MANITESTSGQQPPTGRGSISRRRRRAKLLVWRAALGAAYTAGGVAVTLAGKWAFTVM